ncbi:MAG: DUF5309 family protein [Candidatus Thiodiazotropha sp.]|jgi:hypothetical protein
MSNTNWDSTDLISTDFEGLINEAVMQQIWDISNVPLNFTERAGSGDHGNEHFSWTTDKLAAPSTSNAVVDGADTTGDDSKAGERIGNNSQISVKVVRVSTRARESDTIGRADELAYQVMERQKELRRDVNAQALTEQASVVSDANAGTAGVSGGLFAFIRDTGQTKAGNALVGATGARPGVAVAGAGPAAVTPGTVRALSETLVRDAVELSYNDGGNPTVMLTLPALIRKFSEYLFTSSARIAALYSETGQGAESVTAKGSVNVFVTDFGTLELVPERVMVAEAADRTNVGILDMEYIDLSYLHGYRVEPLAKTGLADNRLMCVDYGLCVKSLDAHATICDIDYTLDVVA